MANKYLARDDAPFAEEVWDVLDHAMEAAAKSQLAGRRLLPVEGPLGLGVKSIPLPDAETEDGYVAAQSLPLLMMREDFTMSMRDLANYEKDGIGLTMRPVVKAAIATAQKEDELIFNGAGGTPGLLTVDGVNAIDLSAWDDVGAAAEDVIQAVTTLDEAGFHGPYALALAPKRYNLLLRRYPQGNQSEIEHLKTMAAAGIIKAPVLEDGGVMLVPERQSASIYLGQDMIIGFVGPAGDQYEFYITESLALRIRQPQAICVLNG